MWLMWFYSIKLWLLFAYDHEITDSTKNCAASAMVFAQVGARHWFPMNLGRGGMKQTLTKRLVKSYITVLILF